MKRKWGGNRDDTRRQLLCAYTYTHTHKKAKMCQKRVAQEQLQDIILKKQREKSGCIEKKSLQQKKKVWILPFAFLCHRRLFFPSFFFFFTVSATLFLYSFASKRFTLACRSSRSFSDLSRFLK